MDEARRRAEAPGEAPGGKREAFGGAPEVPGGRWLTVSEVAQIVGMSERSARDWIKRHDLPVNDGRPLRVAAPAVYDQLAREHRPPRRPPEAPGAAPGGTAEVPGGTEPIEAAYRVAGEAAAEVALVPLATMVEELRGLADQLAELARRNEALALEVGTLRGQAAGHEAQLAAQERTISSQAETVALQRETIAALRQRAEAAEVALVRRDAADTQEAASEPARAADGPSGMRGLLGRARRWWRGTGR